MRDILDAIRDACRVVSDGARHVRIDHDRLRTYAREFPVDAVRAPFDDPGRQRTGDDESTAAFVIALDAVNFGSGYFPYLRKRAGMSGYFTIATQLRDHVDATGPITARALRALTPTDCEAIFDQRDQGAEASELMQLFARALNELGDEVEARHRGSFVELVHAADRSAAALVALLDRLPSFHDVSVWRGLEVPLFKRAQITAYDLGEAFGGTGPGRFDDLHRLTMFADNLVPHVLRVDDVLRFDEDLVERIERVEDITAGSEPEVEIRAVALHAVELLGDLLRAEGHDVTSGQLDAVLWNRGGGPAYKAVPRHRTRTTAY